jgi:superfamily I DNA/RNA helicase
MTAGESDGFFVNFFDQDPAAQAQLQQLASQLQPNDAGSLFDYCPTADEFQRRFIDSTADIVRLLAPAGSGKTQSIVNLVLSKAAAGDPVSRSLILTFDNAAATSLRQKFRDGMKAHNVAGQPQVMTLNSFGYSHFRGVLSNQYGALKLGNDVSSDGRTAVRAALDDLRNQRRDVGDLLPRRLGFRVYLQLISHLKNNIFLHETLKSSPEERLRFLKVAADLRLLDPWLAPLAGRADQDRAQSLVVSALLYIYAQYEKVMRSHRHVDFDDQKLLPYLAFLDNPALASAAMAAYTTVIVDEFQDINRLDFELLCVLARGKRLIVVGDDDQAIYAFRGCSAHYIMGFAEHIGREVETHILRRNYRCPKNVVEMGNRLIRNNPQRVEKDQVADRADDADFQFWHCVNSASEAQIIARTIRHIYSQKSAKGFQYGDVAILFRMNCQSLPLQMALILEEIPYHCRRDENVIVSQTMEQLLGLIRLHLRLLADPSYHSKADTRLLCECFFRYLPKGADEPFHKLVEARGGYLPAADNVNGTLPFQYPCTLAEFRRALRVLLTPATPFRLVEAIGGAFKSLGGLIGSLEEAVNDQLPLGELADIAGRFKGDTRQFHALLQGLLEKVRGGLYHEEEGDAVNLLTYFRAKGRQWNCVFLPGVNQKVIPHARSHVEDERRLFYVALTRATSELGISFVRNAVRCPVEPSQFLEEIGLTGAVEKRAALLPLEPPTS